MYKKLLIGTIILVASIFIFSYCFGADNNMTQDIRNTANNVTNGIRNTIGNAENTIEGATNNVAGASRNTTRNMENNDNGNKNNNNADYNATRTATGTTGGSTTFMGMTATTWTWLIMGIAAFAIIALVWYYSTKLRSSDYNEKH